MTGHPGGETQPMGGGRRGEREVEAGVRHTLGWSGEGFHVFLIIQVPGPGLSMCVEGT